MNVRKKLKKHMHKFRDRYHDINFELPVEDIGDLIIGDDGTYKLVARVIPVNAELEPDSVLENITGAIMAALNTFQGRIGIYIQSEKVDISSNIDYIQKQSRYLDDKANDDDLTKTEKKMYEIKTNLLGEQKKHLEELTSIARSVLNFYVVLEIPAKDIYLAEHLLKDAFTSFKAQMKDMNMPMYRVLKHEIRSMLYERMNPEGSKLQPYYEEWHLQNLYPEESFRYENGRIQVESKKYRFYSITYYPTTLERYRWLRKIFDFKGDINIAIILTPKPKRKIQKNLSKAVNEYEGKALAQKNAAIKLSYKDHAKSAMDMITNISRENISIYDVNITIGVASKDALTLDTYDSLLMSKIGGLNMQATELIRKDFEPFYTVLPILVNNKITKDYVWNMTTADVASIIPFDSSEYMENKGSLVGENGTSGGIVIAEYRNDAYNNAHMSVVAETGAGKSYFLCADAIRNFPYTDYTIVFDIKGDLKFPCGTKYEFSAISGIVVNPFHIRNMVIDSEANHENGKTDVGLYLIQKIMELQVFFKWLIPEMNKLDESILHEDIQEAYALCGLTFESKYMPEKFCTMTDLGKIMDQKIKSRSSSFEIERREYIKACLNPFIVGAYSKMFNGQTNWDFDYFTVLDISNVPEAVQKPIYDILLKDVWQFAKKDGARAPSRKDIYIDEAHKFIDPENPQTIDFVSSKLSKMGRGFGVRLVVATQNLATDFLAIPRLGQAILDNSYFKVFMKTGNTDIEVAQNLYHLSNAEVNILRGTDNARGTKSGKGKGIMIIGTQKVIIQTIASKFELEFIDPKQFENKYKVKSRYI